MAPLATNFAENLGRMVIHSLAVAGAFVVGLAVTRVLVWLICRFAIHRQPPPQAKKILGVAGGVACAALAVAMLFQSGGGAGWGFGPGWGMGKGTGTGDTTEREKKDAGDSKVDQEGTKSDPLKKPAVEPNDKLLPPFRIRMLGGELVKEERFYLPEGEKSPLAFADLKELLRRKRRTADGAPAFKEVVIVITADSVAGDHPAVRQLVAFVRGDMQLSVGISRPDDS